jgi:hypothetical protein
MVPRTLKIVTLILVLMNSFCQKVGAARACESFFEPAEIDLLAKSGLKPNEIEITAYHKNENRVWIELRKAGHATIGRMGLWPRGHRYFQVEIVLLENGYEGKGLGFLMYASAAGIAAKKYHRTLSTRRDRHSNSTEALWQKMVDSGAADIRHLPLHELVNYLNGPSSNSPITPDELMEYIDRFGQSIYVLKDQSAAAKAAMRLYRISGKDFME